MEAEGSVQRAGNMDTTASATAAVINTQGSANGYMLAPTTGFQTLSAALAALQADLALSKGDSSVRNTAAAGLPVNSAVGPIQLGDSSGQLSCVAQADRGASNAFGTQKDPAAAVQQARPATKRPDTLAGSSSKQPSAAQAGKAASGLEPKLSAAATAVLGAAVLHADATHSHHATAPGSTCGTPPATVAAPVLVHTDGIEQGALDDSIPGGSNQAAKAATKPEKLLMQQQQQQQEAMQEQKQAPASEPEVAAGSQATQPANAAAPLLADRQAGMVPDANPSGSLVFAAAAVNAAEQLARQQHKEARRRRKEDRRLKRAAKEQRKVARKKRKVIEQEHILQQQLALAATQGAPAATATGAGLSTFVCVGASFRVPPAAHPGRIVPNAHCT